ncbi:hypothetical protein [Ottowia sp.]|uniref:hypothetical protein n=1 Tax=Ottowia sp. TaxID=1898956 RepID=UPI003A8BE406
MSSQYPLKANDVKGRPLVVGDWVRVAVLPDIAALDRHAKRAFCFALGKTFRIDSFDRYGHAELDLSRKLGSFETIWVEPAFLSRSRAVRRTDI